MGKQRVLLLGIQSLLAESLERILSCDETIELIGPWQPNGRVSAWLSEAKPDVVLVAQGDEADHVTGPLVAQILEQHPDVPVICVGLAHNVVRVYTSSTLPARSQDLLDAVRRSPRQGLARSTPARAE